MSTLLPFPTITQSDPATLMNTLNQIARIRLLDISDWNSLSGQIGTSSNNSFINIKNLGVKGDGVTDDTAAINAALALGNAIYIPPSIYLVSGALNITQNNTYLFGGGAGSIIKTNNATADIFTCSSGLTNIIFSNFSVSSSVNKSAGNAFTCPNAARYKFIDMNLRDPADASFTLYGGIALEGCDSSIIMQCQIWTCSQNAITVYGNGAYASGLYIGGGTRIVGNAAGTTVGITCAGSFGGLYVDQCDVSGCSTDLEINKSATSVGNREIFLGPLCSLDACTNQCMHVAAGSAAWINISGTWFASAGLYGTPTGNQSGLVIDASNPNLVLQVTGARFFACASFGAAISDGQVSFVGCNFQSCSTNANTAALAFAGAYAEDAQVIGNTFYANTTAALNLTLGVGKFQIKNNDMSLSNGSTINIASGSFSLTDVIQGNIGYVTENSGANTVASGTTSITFNHGLAASPIYLDVTPASTPGTNLWFVGASSTQITINLTGPAAADIVFLWRASMNRSG